jgi:hypothetical protein
MPIRRWALSHAPPSAAGSNVDAINDNPLEIDGIAGSLAQASDALRYLVEGRPFGKVVLTI